MADVSVSVTFRHTQPTAALKSYVEEKLKKIGKYFYRPLEAHVVLSVDSKDRQLAEVTLQTRRLKLHGREETADLYAAIDLAVDKIEQQIRKHKSKLQKKRTKG
ncbi:MAG TPA: ribosome-associated translation inhibitor RaiA [Candidatus Acidoferrales bacterium]|nr:ribosome-associated translation inhibitor RaiA [Candidatus Acidoferrales bacterium]